MIWAALGMVFLLVAGFVSFVALARRTVALNLPQKTPEAAKIKTEHEAQRAQIVSDAPADVTIRDMSNEELEKLANDRTSLTPVPVPGASDATGGGSNGG